jgi:hypothetical protein
MTERTMRHALLLSALTVLVWSHAAVQRAEAQQAINGNATIYINDKKLKNGSSVYISKAQCEADWKIELQGYYVTVPFLEMWVTNNVSTNCADAANRVNNNLTSSVCWQVGGYHNSVRGNTTFTARGPEIFNSVDRGDTTKCDADIRGTKYKVQFVTLDSSTQMGASTVTAANSNPNQITALLTLYSAIPKAPENPRGVSGGTTLGLKWDKIDNDPLTEYRVYVDHDPTAPTYPPDIDAGAVSCGTGAFNASMSTAPDGAVTTSPATGQSVKVDNLHVFQSSTTKGSSTSIGNLDDKNIGVNTYSSVAVAAIDGAGNIGELSKPVCVKRVNAQGYLGTCRGDAGVDCGDLESCSLSPRNTGSAFWLSACTLAISAWARRRRRSI